MRSERASACFAPVRGLYFFRHYDMSTGYTWLVADGLATGAMLAALGRGPWGTRAAMRRITVVLLTSGFAMFAVGYPFGILRASRLLGVTMRATALNLLFGGAILFALLAGSSRWKALVNRPVLRFFGEISYGLYLVHIIVFDLEDYAVNRFFPGQVHARGNFGTMVLMFSIALTAAVGITYLSRRYFEEFFLQLKRRF